MTDVDLMERAQQLGVAARHAEMLVKRRAGASLSEIGRQYHVSRQRVHQITMRAAQRLDVAPVICPECGAPKPVNSEAGPCAACRAKRVRTCHHCGKSFEAAHGTYAYCAECRYVTKPCGYCGRPITRDRGREAPYVRGDQWYCNRDCYNAGVKARPIQDLERVLTAAGPTWQVPAGADALTPAWTMELRQMVQERKAALTERLRLAEDHVQHLQDELQALARIEAALAPGLPDRDGGHTLGVPQ